MAMLPKAERAILDIRKLEEYCLDPTHPRGRHKARVFRAALGIGREDAGLFGWLRVARIVHNVLGAVVKKRKAQDSPKLLDVVALTLDQPTSGLARGQVGTVVEQLDDDAVLVEFSGDDGHAYAVVPCNRSELLVLHYAPVAA